MPTVVDSIFRYPVKGLSAEALSAVSLAPGECIPQDRRFAIAKAATYIDPARPQWLPKTSFFMLMRDEALAQLQTHFEESTGTLTIRKDGEVLAQGSLFETSGRSSIDAFFHRFLNNAPGAPGRLVEAPGHSFSDASRKPGSTTLKYLSLLNLASIRELEKVAKVKIDPIRFRANFYLEGARGWDELEWVGRGIRIGTARLRVLSPTTRCAATNVNPVTAKRDLDIPDMLQREFGHICMGVYAEVVDGGRVSRNDLLEME